MSNNDNNAILKLDLTNGESNTNKFSELYNGLFILFYFIMKKPLDNFWFECISLIIQYFQIAISIIKPTVSNVIMIIIIYSFFQFGKKMIYYKKYLIYLIIFI